MHPVDAYIYKCPSPEREIMAYLHHLFLKLQLKPKLSYGLPFYYGKRWLCYLHPLKEGGLELCFPRAQEFEDPTGLLQIKSRKRIKGITINNLNEINESAILKIVDVAIEIDQAR